MIIIGLTGPSGAGKGTVGSIFQRLGADVIDCDALYHSLLVPPSPCVDAIISEFGGEYLRPDGTLDRKRLSISVFSDAQKLARLNEITHAFVGKHLRETLDKLSASGSRVAVIDAPTLIEAGVDRLCDTVVVVTAERETRICRIMERDRISRDSAEMRVNAQPDDSFYLERADTVIQNDKTPEALTELIRNILTSLKRGTE